MPKTNQEDSSKNLYETKVEYNSPNQLILGDCIDVLKTLPDESVDLCYIDPPFFSNRNYEVIWGDTGEVRSFQDRWSGGLDHYIGWLKERVEQIHRVLKPTGSFYLHCDWHADAYIRVFILDKVFGEKNFRNEIIWNYEESGLGTINNSCMPRKHDNIFWYSKSQDFIYQPQLRDYKPEYKKLYIKQDSTGFFREKWRYNNGEGHKVRQYMKEGVPFSDNWCIGSLTGQNKERLGYPTQKPESLLERIIKTSSNEGDVVLDCFVGGGTTIAVADRLKRRWIGIDQSVQAITVSEDRLNKQQGLFDAPFTKVLHKYDYDTLRYKDAFEFESWIVQKFGGFSNAKQRGDLGLDGKKDGVPIQVKRSDTIGRNVVDNFVSAIRRVDKSLFEKRVADQKTVGYIIAFSFGKGAVQEVARLKNTGGVIIELVCVENIVSFAHKPNLKIVIETEKIDDQWQVTFVPQVNTENLVEMYSWDWDFDVVDHKFKADTVRDLSGKQTKILKPGYHNIACKVVDSEGLQGVEVISMKINGIVKVLTEGVKV